MSALKLLLQTHPDKALAIAGGLIGFIFGWLAGRFNFCVMGALSDWRTSRNGTRLAAVALAAATALAGAQSLDALALTDLSKSIYLIPRINWAGAILGGILFGVGMVYAGGCASRNLVRAGAGDMRSLLVLLLVGIAGYATMSGFLAPLRAAIDEATAIATAHAEGGGAASLAGLFSQLGLSPAQARIAAFALIMVPLVAYAAKLARGNGHSALFAGIGVGLLVTAGWLVTGLAADDMSVRSIAPSSLSFVRPVGDALDWLARSTALGWPAFGAASVFGVIAGSALSAWAAGTWRLHPFTSKDDMVRHIFGALAMGVGGVLSLGCSIGQGVTGLSTLSVQSIIAAAAIALGASIGFARLERSI